MYRIAAKKLILPARGLSFKNNNLLNYRLPLLLVLFTITGLVLLTLTSSYYHIFKIVQLICFILAGRIHAKILSKNIPGNQTTSFKRRLTSAAVVVILLLAGLLLLYAFIEWEQSFMALGSTAAFILPYLIHEQWQQFGSIPEKKYPP